MQEKLSCSGAVFNCRHYFATTLLRAHNGIRDVSLDNDLYVYNCVSTVGCEYGDKAQWCASYVRGPNECQRPEVAELCCQRCNLIACMYNNIMYDVLLFRTTYKLEVWKTLGLADELHTFKVKWSKVNKTA